MLVLDQAFKALDLGDLKSAEAGFRRALDSSENHGQAYWGLARVATLSGQKDAAIKLYAHCCNNWPGRPEPLIGLGEALSGRNRFEEAGTTFAAAAECAGEYAPAHYALGVHLTGAGQPKQAQIHLRQALSIQPDFALAWEALGRLATFDPASSDLQQINALIESRECSPRDQIALHYALGKVHDEQHNDTEAFDHWTQANELQLSACSYRVKDMQPFFSRLTKCFADKQSGGANAATKHTLTPLFILGQPRSGSTVLEQLLLNHSQVASAGETGFLGNEIAAMASGMTNKAFPDSAVSLTPEQRAQLANRYLSFLARYSGEASHVIDKLPANYQSIGFIKSLLPQAKILHLYRSPAETCFSIFRQHFVSNEPFFCTLPEIVSYHRFYQSVMAQWHQQLPGFIHDIRYEDLASNPEQVIREVLVRCDLPWQQACADLSSDRRHISTLSDLQARSKVASPDSNRQAERYRALITTHFSGFTDADWN